MHFLGYAVVSLEQSLILGSSEDSHLKVFRPEDVENGQSSLGNWPLYPFAVGILLLNCACIAKTCALNGS